MYCDEDVENLLLPITWSESVRNFAMMKQCSCFTELSKKMTLLLRVHIISAIYQKFGYRNPFQNIHNLILDFIIFSYVYMYTYMCVCVAFQTITLLGQSRKKQSLPNKGIASVSDPLKADKPITVFPVSRARRVHSPPYPITVNYVTSLTVLVIFRFFRCSVYYLWDPDSKWKVNREAVNLQTPTYRKLKPRQIILHSYLLAT